MKTFFCDLALYFYIYVLQCNVFHISFLFLARLQPIAASTTLIKKSTTLEYLPCLYTRTCGEPSARTTATVTVKVALTGGAIAAYVATTQTIDTLRGCGAPDLSNSSTTKAKPTTDQTISSLGGVPMGVVPFEGFSGEHSAGERAHRAERSSRNCSGLFLTKHQFQ